MADELSGSATPSSVVGTDLARAAALAGLTRLVPVPFLDDVLLRRVHRGLVAGVLERRGRAELLPHLRPLWDDGSGCLAGVAWFVITLPVKLVLKLLKLILRTVFFVLAIRATALTMSGSALLGRALDRHLAQGGFAPGMAAPALEAEARRLAAAIAAAGKGTDLRALQGLLAASLRGAKGLMRRARPAADATEVAKPGTEERRALDALADVVRDAFAGPEAVAFLAAHDRRVDDELRRQEGLCHPPHAP